MWRKNTIFILMIVFIFSDYLFAVNPKSPLTQDNSFPPDSTVANHKAKNSFYTIRFGIGGFSDNRSPSGRLMGAQLIFDAKPFKYPIAISASAVEFYSSSSDPEHSYQIQNMGTFNIFYTIKPAKFKDLKIFCGGGIGGLQVPKDNAESDDDGVVSLFYDLEAGINYKIFKKIGIYGTVKYIYAQKKEDGIHLVDFNEFIYVLGVSFNFGF